MQLTAPSRQELFRAPRWASMKDKNSNRDADLPLSVEALGGVTWNGTATDSAKRVSRQGKAVLLDQTFVHLKAPVAVEAGAEQALWLRVPPFVSPGVALPKTRFAKIDAIVDDPSLPLHGLCNLDGGAAIPIAGSADTPRRSEPLDTAAIAQLKDAEQKIVASRRGEALQLLAPLAERWPHHPRILFALGALYVKAEEYQQARAFFHRAMLSGHPDALEAEWSAVSQLGATFRRENQEIFERIHKGERLRVITHLRVLRKREPIFANAALAFCLRGAGEPEEGIEVCRETLALDPLQSDVYGHLWSFLTDLGRDREALDVALRHLALYPLNPQAYTDALDSALLLGDLSRATQFAHGYLLHSLSAESALKNFFKLHEYSGDWAELRRLFEVLLPLSRAHTPDTLVRYGETLTEVGDSARGKEVLERAMAAAPERADAIIAYARLLARSDDEHGAVRFLSSVVSDPNRNDSRADRYLILTLLSEILRRTGRLVAAREIWPPAEEFTPTLLAEVGPCPFAEFAECCHAAGQTADAQRVYQQIAAAFAHLPQVQRLKELVVQ